MNRENGDQIEKPTPMLVPVEEEDVFGSHFPSYWRNGYKKDKHGKCSFNAYRDGDEIIVLNGTIEVRRISSKIFSTDYQRIDARLLQQEGAMQREEEMTINAVPHIAQETHETAGKLVA